jgi:hypothetical protein
VWRRSANAKRRRFFRAPILSIVPFVRAVLFNFDIDAVYNTGEHGSFG